MITRGIREFMARDWRAVRDAKDAYWGERITRLGPLEAFRVADELRRQAIAQNPSWPHLSDRRSDLDAHVRVAGLFRRGHSACRP